MRILIPILTLFLCSACETQSKTKVLDINGFDWTNKKIIELQPELNEISGIAYDKNKHRFLAINDEQGILFVLNSNDYTIQKKLKFGKKGDYECVSVNEDKVFVLRSDGNLYTMIYNDDSISKSNHFTYTGPATEFETSLWDNRNKQLSIVSKKSVSDKAIQANNIYNIDLLSGQYSLDPANRISWESIRKKGFEIKGFHPSGAAIQPATGNIFVISSIEKLLVIFNSAWQVISVHHLDKVLFRQPEGIVFDKEGNLLITNEAADAKPTLVFIPIKK